MLQPASVTERGGFVWLFYGDASMPQAERPPVPADAFPELDPGSGWHAVYGEMEWTCNHALVFENAARGLPSAQRAPASGQPHTPDAPTHHARMNSSPLPPLSPGDKPPSAAPSSGRAMESTISSRSIPRTERYAKQLEQLLRCRRRLQGCGLAPTRARACLARPLLGGLPACLPAVACCWSDALLRPAAGGGVNGAVGLRARALPA